MTSQLAAMDLAASSSSPALVEGAQQGMVSRTAPSSPGEERAGIDISQLSPLHQTSTAPDHRSNFVPLVQTSTAPDMSAPLLDNLGQPSMRSRRHRHHHHHAQAPQFSVGGHSGTHGYGYVPPAPSYEPYLGSRRAPNLAVRGLGRPMPTYQEMQALKARREAHKHNLGLRRTASATAIPAVPASGTHTPAIGAPAVGNGPSVVAHDHLSPQSTRLPFATHTSSFGNGKGVDTHKEDTRSISSSSSSSSSDSIVLPNPWARFRYHTREFWAEFLCAITSIVACELIVQRHNVPHLLFVDEFRGSR